MSGGMFITVEVNEASDSWGFVGVVKVGDSEAYRTLEAFPSQLEALEHTQGLVAGTLGELLAGQEWRHVRDAAPHRGAPTRKDFRLNSLFGGTDASAADITEQATPGSGVTQTTG